LIMTHQSMAQQLNIAPHRSKAISVRVVGAAGPER